MTDAIDDTPSWSYDGWVLADRTDEEYYNRYIGLWTQCESKKPIEETLGRMQCGDWITQIGQINIIAEKLHLMRWEPNGQDWAKQ